MLYEHTFTQVQRKNMDIIIPGLSRPQLAAKDVCLAVDDGQDLR